MPALYAITSGVVHGMPHRLNDNATIASRRAEWNANPFDVGGSVLAALRAAHTTLTAHCQRRAKFDPFAAAEI
jgi:hypothetical protein